MSTEHADYHPGIVKRASHPSAICLLRYDGICGQYGISVNPVLNRMLKN